MTNDASADELAGFDPDVVIASCRALTPHVVRVNATLVHRRFWPKIRRLARHIPFADDVLALFFCAIDPQTPTRTKGMVLAALAYFILPTDFIPDWIPGVGYADDAAVIAAAVALAGRAIQPRHREAARAQIARLAGDA